ncbi:hypothetical protein KBB27_00360 [Patescibacteria group bacterium]|nr:hypothetical protein [Patescibacteria group bacterium]
MRERFRLNSERRTSIFARQLDTIETELAKRDYATLSIENGLEAPKRTWSDGGTASLHRTRGHDRKHLGR